MSAAAPPGKSPLVAVLASLLLYFLPGAGQMYAGQFSRGVRFLLATYGGAVGVMYAQLSFWPGAPRWPAGVLLAAWWGYMAYDAYRCALRSPPTVEDAALAANAAASEGVPSPPAFEPASPALRWTWAATRWAMLGLGALLASWVVFAGLLSAREGVKAGSPAAAAWALLVAGAGAALLAWLAGRARRVYAAAAGPAPLPADRLGADVRSFLATASALAALLAFGLFVTQGIWRDLVRKSSDGATRGHLASIRLALHNSRADELGLAPAALDELVPRHLEGLPKTQLRVSTFSRLHADSSAVRVGASPTDEGGWLYDAAAGAVFVNCTHTDAKRSVWSSY